MGVKAYSLTLSWSRIMPFGRGPVNELAIAHYNDVINTCIEYNIIPMVTLYHWDTPLALQDTYGAWLSEDIVNDFVAYARVAFAAFGDRVDHWFTVNERTYSEASARSNRLTYAALVYCGEFPFPAMYFKNFTIPNVEQPFHCYQSTLLAHSQAYRLGKSMMPNSTM